MLVAPLMAVDLMSRNRQNLGLEEAFASTLKLIHEKFYNDLGRKRDMCATNLILKASRFDGMYPAASTSAVRSGNPIRPVVNKE